MMTSKDALRFFKAATWASKRDIDAYVAEVGALPASELAKLLAILLDKGLSANVAAHQCRCAAFAAVAEKTLDPELCAHYIRALRACDASVRAVLIPLIPKVNSVSAHAEACQLLRSPDPEVRASGAEILRQVGGKGAFEVLAQMIREPSFAGRIEALDAMVPKVGHLALPLVASVLSAGKPPEKVHALKLLTHSRYFVKDLAGALRVAAAALEDPSEMIAARALPAIAALGSEEDFLVLAEPLLASSSLAIVRSVVESMRRHPTPRVLGLLGQKFRDGPSTIRLAVVETLEAIGGDEVVPLLVEGLSHRQLAMRTRAADALAQLSARGSIDVARTLIWLLRSGDVNVRRHGVEIANKVSDPKGELGPRLLRFLRDEDWWVRERVMDALIEMMGVGLTHHIVEYLKDPSDIVRRFAVGALRRIKDPKSLGALVRCAKDDTDWWVREEALGAIGELADKRAVPYVLELLGRETDLRLACVHALRALGAREAAARVAELLSDRDPDLRLAALQCLTELDDSSVAGRVKACEKDGSFPVRRAAEDLLRRWNVVGRPATQAARDASLTPLDELLVAVAKAEAEDLLLAAGRVPYVKQSGKMVPLSADVLSGEDIRTILFPHLSLPQRQALDEQRDLDFSHDVRLAKLRFRANVFQQLSGLSAVFRSIKNEIVDVGRLGLPPIVQTFGDLRHGLVLVGGPTGSGKSTTLAAIIDYINRTSSRHIITVEDPIEVVHVRNRCIINQREVGTHTRSFGAALRATLREDPDVILVGEMRDLETISFAVTAAETGHLVFGTLHTVSADSSIDRLLNAFPPRQQPQVRSMLAETLRAVVCQHLLRRKGESGRIVAAEVLLNNDAISNMIRKGKTFQIPGVITTSREIGMQSMDLELVRLVNEGKVEVEEAFVKAADKKTFETLVTAAAERGQGKGRPAASQAQRPATGATEPIPRERPAPQRQPGP